MVLSRGYPAIDASGPLSDEMGPSRMNYDGLGAARGQRPRKGPCASYPTRQ
jgi:hypothetical protein